MTSLSLPRSMVGGGLVRQVSVVSRPGQLGPSWEVALSIQWPSYGQDVYGIPSFWSKRSQYKVGHRTPLP